jgi:hypothetical protein
VVVTPWPRYVSLPAVEPIPIEGWGVAPEPWAPHRHRFTVVAVVASWNPATVELADWLSRLAVEFGPRRVRVLALFSHDTSPAAARFLARARAKFEAGLAPPAFIEGTGNPKVPTVWVTNPRGEIVTRKELPNETERKRVRDDLIVWTDF